MKNAILVLSFLVFAVGCDSDSQVAKKAESCTYNDKPMDCNEFRRITGQTPEDPAAQQPSVAEPKKGIALEVKATGKYQIKNGKLKTLTSFEKSTVSDSGDRCSITLGANVEMEVEADERELNLVFEGQSTILNRVEGSEFDEENLILGSFEFIEKGDAKTVFKFIDEETLELSIMCLF